MVEITQYALKGQKLNYERKPAALCKGKSFKNKQ